MTKQRVFSGIQPSGDLHIGNYLGAIKNWVKMQEDYDCIFCIVDLHAITVPQDPKQLKENIYKTAALLLACGINPKRSTLFIQSAISTHSELAWVLNCLTPVGWLKRMTQFKEKSSKQKEIVSTGLFDYPVLMAADILLYETDLVPVGEDQKQHVELCREIVRHFNARFGETFKIPASLIQKTGARIMGLVDPKKKMSKSDEHPGQAILLTDSPETIRQKIMSATTDSLKEIVFDKKRPGIYNLLVIYELFTGQTRPEIERHLHGKGYAQFKKELAEVLIEKLKPLQKRYQELMENREELDDILKQGAVSIRPQAEEMLKKIKEKMGLI